MGDAHRRIGRVDVLAASARGAHRVDPDVLGADVDVDLLGLGQHGDRRRRRMDAPAALRLRHALDAMNARFEFQPGEDAFAGNRGDNFLVAADLAFARRNQLDLPALRRRVALIHAEEVAGEKRRLVSAGAGANFEDGVLFVSRILRQHQYLDFLLQRLHPFLHRRPVGFGELAHLLVERAVGQHRLEVGKLTFRRQQFSHLADDVLQFGIFGGELHIGVGLGPGRHLRLEHLEALDDLVHPVARQFDHSLEFLK